MKKKKIKWENLFIIVSMIFILACFGIYGYRLIHYYKKFNPSKKDSNGLLSVEIPKSSTLVTEGKGLYSLNGSYIYRGNVDNNYIEYSGLLFRILKINYGSNIEIILDNKINILAYGNDKNYKDSDINNYLNDVFINSINKDGLEKMDICVDIKSNLQENKKCQNTIKVYSTILDSKTYLTTVNEDTYITNDESLVYLRDKINNDLGNIIANNGQISYIDGNETYDIKPIISLKYDTKILAGTGTKNDPYKVDESNSKLGKTVTLGNEEWIVIKEDNNYSTITLKTPLDNLKPYGESFDPADPKSIAYYLNNDFYNSLEFKNEIVDSNFEIGNYINDYKEIESKKITAKVGLLSIKDFKMDSTESQYILLNKANDDEVYAIDKKMYKIDKYLSKTIRPVVRVNNDIISEVK